jgi:hypothetical protein
LNFFEFVNMGCGSSAHEDRLQTVDDSVHVMLALDKKRQKAKGEKVHGYVPRAEHPLLTRDSVQVMLGAGKEGQEDKGDKVHGYVPRAEHPLLKPLPVQAEEPSDEGKVNIATTTVAEH